MKRRRIAAVCLITAFLMSVAAPGYAAGGAVTDYCETLEYLYAASHIEKTTIDKTNPDTVGDPSRVTIDTAEPKWIEYKLDADAESFRALVSYHVHTDGFEGHRLFTVAVSSDDGDTYQEIAIEYAYQPELKNGDWDLYYITPTAPLPGGVRNIRFHFPEGYITTWSPQFAEVTFTARSAATLSFAVLTGDVSELLGVVEAAKRAVLEEDPTRYEPGAFEKLRAEIDKTLTAIGGFDENTLQSVITGLAMQLQKQIDNFFTRKHIPGDAEKLAAVIAQAEELLTDGNTTAGDSALTSAIAAARVVAVSSPTRYAVNWEVR
ncbi:MAG: hypothetical protein LBH54_04065, partial [Clostridiales bacterium]|nr:hypothetical protein [Clostridiales bacterium]